MLRDKFGLIAGKQNAQFGCVKSKQNTAKEMGRKKEQYGFTKSAREAEGGGFENF